MYAPSTTGSSEGRNSGLLRKAEGRKHYNRTAVTDGDPGENLIWVVRPPVPIRRGETAEKHDRDNGDIKVKVRLLAADAAQVKKSRTPELVKRPAVRREGSSRFKVYQVQRRGEQSAKLVTERTITQKFKSSVQQPINHGNCGPKRTATSPTIEDRGPRLHSEIFSQVKTIPSVGETAERGAQKRSAVFGASPGRHGEGQHVVVEKVGREDSGNKACGPLTTFLSSSCTALPSISKPAAVGDGNGDPLQGNSPDCWPATCCEEASESTRWTAHDPSQYPDAERPDRVLPAAHQKSQVSTWEHRDVSASPSSLHSLRPLQHPAYHHPWSSCTPIADESRSFQDVQKLCYWRPSESGVVPPVVQSLSSSTPGAFANGNAPNLESDTDGDFRRYLVRFSGCATDLTETCGDRCDHGSDAEVRNGFEKRPGISRQINVDSGQTSEGTPPRLVPQQRSILQRIFKFGSVSSAWHAGDETQPSTSKEEATEGRAEAPQQATQQQSFLRRIFSFEKAPSIKQDDDDIKLSMERKRAPEGVSASVQNAMSTTKPPEESPQTWESPPEKKEYAIFLPRRMMQDELRKHDEVPVIFRMLHRRRPEPRSVPPRAVSSPLLSTEPIRPLGSKQVFHFRVLQQQQRRDDEKRRIVTFKAPTHCRAIRAASDNSKQQLETAGSFEPSGFCASPCGEERLSSGSSTSSLITLQYSHRRSYVPLPRVPVSEVQKERDEFPSKVSVSRFAARVAQETIRRVARRRATHRARTQATRATGKKTEDSREIATRQREPKMYGKAETSSDVPWCCAVRDESRTTQLDSAEAEETAAYLLATGGRNTETIQARNIPGTHRETDAESGTSAGESQAVQVQAVEEAVSARRNGDLCKKVGEWLMWGHLSWKGGSREEPQSDLSSQECADAAQYIRGFQGAEDKPSEHASPRQDILSFSQCCEPNMREESIVPDDSPSPSPTSDISPSQDAGSAPSLAMYREAVEGMHSPRPEMDPRSAAPGIVTPPLYSLPVVSFLPPVFEPLPVVETVAVDAPLQLPVCYFSVPASPSHVCVQEAAIGQDNSTVINASAFDVSTLSNRVKICVLPSRGFVAHA